MLQSQPGKCPNVFVSILVMELGNPYGLLWLVAVPLLLALHWYRRPLPVRRVAGVFLWGTSSEPTVPPPTAFSSQGLRASIVLEIVAVLGFVMLVCDLRFSHGTHAGVPKATADTALCVTICLSLLAVLLAKWHIRPGTHE